MSALADLVLLTHLGFILFVILGGLFVLKWKKLAWLHMPCVIWGIGIEITGGICPLTPLENRLRFAVDETGYSGGFIEHYITPLIYPSGLTSSLQVLLGLLLLTAYTIFYSVFFIRIYKKRLH